MNFSNVDFLLSFSLLNTFHDAFHHMQLHARDAQWDMAPMKDDHCLETNHTVQSWEA